MSWIRKRIASLADAGLFSVTKIIIRVPLFAMIVNDKWSCDFINFCLWHRLIDSAPRTEKVLVNW